MSNQIFIQNSSKAKTAFLFAALMLPGFTACTVNDDNPVPPAENPQPKISKIYGSSTKLGETYFAPTDSWMTVVNQTIERRLETEFLWSGDRLESFTLPKDRAHLTYDGDLLIQADYETTQYSYLFEYNSDRQPSHVDVYTLSGGSRQLFKTLDFYYAGGRLAKTVEENILTSDVKLATYQYTWTGDDVTRVDLASELLDGDVSTETISYTMSDMPNPFYGITPLQQAFAGFIYRSYGVEGLNRHMISSVEISGSDIEGYFAETFAPTLSGQRVTAIHNECHIDSEKMRISIVFDYDIEYLD